MAITFNIPLTTMQPGVTSFGPFTLATATTGEQLALNRNVGHSPLQSAPATPDILQAEFQTSIDGGVTWHDAWGYGGEGGVLTDQNGVTVTQDIETSGNHYAAGTQVRVIVTNNSASAITISGSLTLS